MELSKIKVYLFFQISKYFLLILFIFLSIAWILQITRLFSITNFIHIEVIDLFLLSFYLIPNIITIITPFILIFGLLLCFIKLNKNNELISVFTLGFGLKPFKITLFYFTTIVIFLFTILNLYLAPYIYEKYKTKEYELRNTLDFDKMAFSNFLNLNKSTILDFKKNDRQYEDIFISFKDDKDNIIFSKKGNILSKNNEFNFQLSNGFKISIDENKQIEKLEFLNYILKIENRNINNLKINDKNTFTIFDDIKSKNYLNISYKIVDLFLILYVIYLFYHNNLKVIKFNTLNNIYFSSSCILILILNQILKNSEIILFNYNVLVISIILFSLLVTYFKKKYEQN